MAVDCLSGVRDSVSSDSSSSQLKSSSFGFAAVAVEDEIDKSSYHVMKYGYRP